MATHHAVGMALPCRGKPKPGGAEHNLRLLRRGVNPYTGTHFRDGPYAEPGSKCSLEGCSRAVQAWGSGREGESEAIPQKNDASITKAKQRLIQLRQRVLEKAKKKDEARRGA